MLATGADDGYARIFVGGAESAAFKHDSGVSSVALSHESSMLATGSCAGQVRIFDLVTKRPELPFKGGFMVNQVAWNSTSTKLAVASHDSDLRILDPATGAEERLVLPTRLCKVNGVAWSPSGTHIAACITSQKDPPMDDCTLVLDVATGSEQVRFNKLGLASCLAWSPDGKSLVVGSSERPAYILDVSGGVERGHLDHHKAVRSSDMELHEAVRSVAWSPQGNKIATGASDGLARVFDVATLTSEERHFRHGHCVRSVAWDSGGAKLATGASDCRARIFALAAGTDEAEACFEHPGRVLSVSWHA